MRVKVPSSYVGRYLSEERGSLLSGEAWKNHLRIESEADYARRNINEDKSSYRALLKLIPDDYSCENGYSFQDLFFDSLALNKEYADLGILWKFKVKSSSSISSRRGSADILATNTPFTILSLINQENQVIQNIIYNHRGECVVSVDFDERGGMIGPVHWHRFKQPGLPKRDDGDGHVYPYNTCPWIWLALPAEHESQELFPRRMPTGQEYVEISLEIKGNKSIKITKSTDEDSGDDDDASIDEKDSKLDEKKSVPKPKNHDKDKSLKSSSQEGGFKQAVLCLDSAVGGGASVSIFNEGVSSGNVIVLMIAVFLILLMTGRINIQTIQNMLPENLPSMSKKQKNAKNIGTLSGTFKEKPIGINTSESSSTSSSSSSSSSYTTKLH